MASKVILTHLNLEGNEIQNVSLQKLATDPTGENLKNGMLWTNTSSNALLKYYDNGAIRTLLWSSGLGDGQTLTGGTTAGGDLILQSTSHATKGSILIPELSVAGFVKISAEGALSGGNTLLASDIPDHSSTAATYGAADKATYGHVKISNGINVDSGVISADVGTGLTLTGTTPNKKITIDSTVITLTGTQTLTNKTLTTPTISDFTNSTHTHRDTAGGGTLDHGLALTGLDDDDHIQYLLLAGRVGGQTLVGGTASGDNLTFITTSNSTKGTYFFPELASSKVVKTTTTSGLVASSIVASDLDVTFLSTDSTLGGINSSDTVISSQKATKTYIDNAVTGLSWKEAVRVATLTNITLSGLQTIDNITVIAGDRVLVKNQTNKKTNGIYVVATGTWTRVLDANTADKLAKATVFVESGSQADTGWTCSNTSITEWSTDIEFIQFSGSGTYTGGTGINIIGNSIDIDSTVTTLTGTQTLTNKTLTDNVMPTLYTNSSKTHKISFPLSVSDTVVTLATTQTLTNKTLTTPTIGSFINSQHNHTEGTSGGQLTDACLSAAVGATKGGTGQSSYVLGDILYASATNTLSKLAGNTTVESKMLVQTGTGTVSAPPVWTSFVYEQTFGDGIKTDYVITHNLNTRGVKISIWRTVAPYDEIDYYAEKTTLNSITLRFNRVITANEFSISISI